MPEAIDHGKILQPNGGRDELNLAEFPITLLADRVPDGCTEITFEDEVYDHQAGEKIGRRLTVKGDKEYGLPTAIDDEVLFALIQITKLYNDFREREVKFSRYEVLRLLGWRDDSVNYRRLTESLRRWKRREPLLRKGMVEQTRPDLDDRRVQHHRQPLDTRGHRSATRATPETPNHATTSFHWNKVVFQSFQAENLKRIDAKTYFSLKSSVAKRMYRFLDKRFYHKTRMAVRPARLRVRACRAEPQLREERRQDQGEAPAGPRGTGGDRLHRAASQGEAVHQRRGRAGRSTSARKSPRRAYSTTPAPAEPVSDIVKELIQRGVTEATAVELASDHDAATIEAKLEVLDWLVAKKDKRVSKSPAGYLVDSIRKGYAEPKGFESKALVRNARSKKPTPARRRKKRGVSKPRRRHGRRPKQRRNRPASTPIGMSLTPTQQAELMAAAMEADPEKRENIEEQRRRRLMWFVEAMEKNLRNNYIERLLAEKTPA